MGITDIVTTPDRYGSFVTLSRKHQDRTCLMASAQPISVTDETKELYEDYKMQFENYPFNSETTETGNIPSDKIAEAQQKK